MKKRVLFLLLAFALLLSGCSLQFPSIFSSQPEEEVEPISMDLIVFEWNHSGSAANDNYTFSITTDGEKAVLYAEELFSGGRIIDVSVSSTVMQQAEEICGNYRLDQWNGFDRSNTHVSDGSRFSLYMKLADGTEIRAKGNNRFPDRYTEAYSEIFALYNGLMAQYGTNTDES